MLKLRVAFTKASPAVFGRRRQVQQPRFISALYITGDKAKENFAALQPYMDFEDTFRQKELLEHNIAERQLLINLADVLKKYAKYRGVCGAIKQLEEEREAVTLKLRELSKSGAATTADSTELKEQGKTLRNNLKQLKEQSYPIEDDFIHAFLDLPNALHAQCPSANKEKLLYRSAAPRLDIVEKKESHIKRVDLIRFIDNSRYYLMQEAAEFDLNCTHALTSYFVDTGRFIQTSNPDFVRCVLLEAIATPLTQYHKVKEEQQQQHKLNSAYLTGGAAFESFLGAVTRLCVYPSVLPLRYVCNGRLYHKSTETSEGKANLFTATQTNAVQTFVATATASEADDQLESILNLVVDFYKALGVHFRIVYAQAHQLTLSECLRVNIEVYSPAQQRFVCVGHVSNYSDFVSKRILFSARKQKDYHFLHLVGGPVLYTTRLIAALIEQGIPLEQCKLLGAIDAQAELPKRDALDEFKNIFK